MIGQTLGHYRIVEKSVRAVWVWCTERAMNGLIAM
jgi:hypothetical protein